MVGLLLRHNKVEIRTLGASLLAQFEKVQVGAMMPSPCMSVQHLPILTGYVRVFMHKQAVVLLQQEYHHVKPVCAEASRSLH